MCTLMRFTEWMNPETDNLEWLIRKDGCMHCADPGCLKACPSPGAIVQYSNGIVDFIHENCIGCGYCVKGCPFNIPRISQDRPQGLQVHPVLGPRRGGPGAGLRQGLPDQADHVRHQGGHDRAGRTTASKDLKTRGFENAGLYDPPGVGGTHVMYVLHHADKPHIYADLPNDPKISPLVAFWKGGAKMFGLAAMGFAAVGGFFHYVTAGPNEVRPRRRKRRSSTTRPSAARTGGGEARPH